MRCYTKQHTIHGIHTGFIFLGIAVHWYMDPFVPVSFLDDAHEMFPDIFILPSEACTGAGYDGKGVLLGSWERGEEYGHSIMQVKCLLQS